MPKIKVPTSPLKKSSKILAYTRKPLDDMRPGSSDLPRNGLKATDKLQELLEDTLHESEVFSGFSLKAVLKEHSDLVATLYHLFNKANSVSNQSAQPPARELRAKNRGHAQLDVNYTSSSTNESSSSESDSSLSTTPPPSPASQEDYEPTGPKPVHRALLTKTGAVRKRGVRCMECSACLRPDDCGQCEYCRDKPKFGGPGVKKQACIYRKCHNLIRHVPLKSKPKKVYIPEGSPPPPRRPRPSSSETCPLQASPIRPRRFFTGPERPAVRSKVTEPETPHLNIFWPIEADISGTPLYSVKSVTSRSSVCLKCGGGGKVIHCRVCCQTFHPFCAEFKGQADYTCPSCITCRVCGHGNKCVACVLCGGWFHERCTRDHHSTRLKGTWRCVTCTKCLSCKTTTPGKERGDVWYEDFTYCKACHSLKVKGNYCPLCGECYSDSDYDSKMVQCGRCDHWVHATCEGMGDEEYEILSELPEDSVLFLCRLCSSGDSQPKSSWKQVVNTFFQNSLAQLMESFGRGRSELKQVAQKLQSQEYSTLVDFHSDIMSTLSTILSSLSASSASHRQLKTAKNSYEELLSQLFPWFNEEEKVSSDVTKETTPTPRPLEWPHFLSHDHCYMSNGEPAQRGVVSEESATPTNDQRKCALCAIPGDTGGEGPGRLLSCGVDEWIHVNCAVWSAEVYEEVTGTLRSVQVAITRGSRLRCDECREVGATVGCCTSTCSANYHFQCARNARCVFLSNKEVYCHKHRDSVQPSDVMPELELTNVDRCVFVDAHPDRPGRKVPRQLEATKMAMQLGSLVVSKLGQLVELSDTPTSLFPHNYSANCEFWSIDRPLAVTRYTLSITAAKPEDWIMHSDPILVNSSSPTNDELGLPTVEVGVADSVWDELLPPLTKKRKVHSPSPPRSVPVITKSTNGVSVEALPTSIMSNMTFVPYFKDSTLLLLPAQPLNGSKESTGSLPHRAVHSFKIPKRGLDSLSVSPTNQTAVSGFATPTLTSSEEAVANSVMLQRLKAGLHGNPFSLTFTVTSGDGHSWCNNRLEELWESVLGELQLERAKLDLPFVPYNSSNVYRQFGLSHPLLVQLVEQLPDAPRCTEYQFQYHQPSLSKHWRSLRTLENPTGCARSEPFNGIRSPRDMFSFLTSDHRPEPPPLDHQALEIIMATAESTAPAKIQTTSDLPAAMRYRSLQKTYKQHVGVFGSRIHGLGLFCVKEIEAGEMVIEYTGTVIRSVLTDKREKIYDSKGIGCYMFRIDSDDVVDATMSGNQARFINHSCEPNCYSKVITCDGGKKIMIFAIRKILPGEELTYDYKFPLEEAKIPCSCGARRCRKTMN